MFTIKVRGDYIRGKFKRARKSPRKIISIDPGDSGYRIGAFPVEPAHVDRAVEAAREAADTWGRVEGADRAHALRRFAAQVVNRRAQLSQALCAETGKPLWLAEKEVEQVIDRVESEISEGMQAVASVHLPEIRFAVEGHCHFRPLGVMAILGTASSPLAEACHAILPALLAGNTVVFKPSKLAPACGQLLAELFDEADWPKGVFNMVQGDAALGLDLVARSEVDGVWFTGSGPAGKRVLQAAADPLRKLVALHLGGLNTAMVLDDADLDRAIYQCVLGTYANTGQALDATALILVDKRVFEAFVPAFVETVRSLKVGYGADPGVFMGPLLSEFALERGLDRLARLKAAGARELLASERIKLQRPGFYLSPSVFAAPKPDLLPALLSEGLSFGPDAILIPFSTDKQAIELANATRRPFVASVVTEDSAHFEQVAEELRYGHIHHNLATCDRSMRLPSQGVGDSGNHRAGGLHAQRSCGHPVSILRSTDAHDSSRQVKAFPGRYLIRED